MSRRRSARSQRRASGRRSMAAAVPEMTGALILLATAGVLIYASNTYPAEHQTGAWLVILTLSYITWLILKKPARGIGKSIDWTRYHKNRYRKYKASIKAGEPATLD